MTTTRKLIGAAAFSLALAGGGMAGALLGSPVTSGAQESTTTPDDTGTSAASVHPRGERLETAAEALGLTAEELRAELEDGKTIAEVAAAQGVELDTVIDALVAEATEDIRERVTAFVNGEAPLRGAGREHRGPGREQRGFGPRLDAVASALGITEDELHAALRDGQSIADVAAAEDVDLQTVIDTLVADATTHLDEEVAEGDLTEEEAAARKADLETRITEMVNREGGFRTGGHRGPRP